MLVLICFGVTARAQSQQGAENATEVVIRAKRQRSVRSRGAIQSFHWQPQQANEFNFVRMQSIGLSATRQDAHPSGWSLPRIRGQDPRNTEVFIDQVPITDAYAQIPAVDLLDLRAFGAVDVYEGVLPNELPSVNGVGALNFKSTWFKKPRSVFGEEYGRPFGRAHWVEASGTSTHPGPQLAWSLFAKSHHTDGRYAYYSDEGTPYGRDDDRIRWRTDAQSTSSQILPRFRFQAGPWLVKAIVDAKFTRAGNWLEQNARYHRCKTASR